MPRFLPEFPIRLGDSVLADWVDLAEQVAVCGRSLRAAISRMAGHRQLTEAQLSILWVCSKYTINGVHQANLAAALAISSAHVSSLVEQLRSRGLLVGSRAAPDRRCQTWRLTEMGQACLASVLADLAGKGKDLDQPIAGQDRQAFLRLLDRLVDAFPSEPVRGGLGRNRFPRLKAVTTPGAAAEPQTSHQDGEESVPLRYGGAAA